MKRRSSSDTLAPLAKHLAYLPAQQYDLLQHSQAPIFTYYHSWIHIIHAESVNLAATEDATNDNIDNSIAVPIVKISTALQAIDSLKLFVAQQDIEEHLTIPQLSRLQNSKF